jgi:hypothetical protein
MKFPPRIRKAAALTGLALAVLLITALSVSAEAGSPPASYDWSVAAAALPASEALPASISPTVSQTDPCLHCHITGEDKGLWTPLARWTLFGGAGMLMIFGVYRSASGWLTRSPWKPLTLRSTEWVDERYNISAPLSKVLSKPVPKSALRWFYCLGGITGFLFAIQAVTGIMLAFYYKPTPEAAYASIQYIETQVRFGAAVRAIHHWAANGMILMCTAHMLRVFVMGAFKKPRELNWISGVVLLVLTLVFGFTGYLLPWDQRAFWATTVGTEIAAAIPIIGNLSLVFLRVGWGRDRRDPQPLLRPACHRLAHRHRGDDGPALCHDPAGRHRSAPLGRFHLLGAAYD